MHKIHLHTWTPPPPIIIISITIILWPLNPKTTRKKRTKKCIHLILLLLNVLPWSRNKVTRNSHIQFWNEMKKKRRTIGNWSEKCRPTTPIFPRTLRTTYICQSVIYALVLQKKTRITERRKTDALKYVLLSKE